MSEWISIKDRLPKLRQTILSTDGEVVAVTAYLYNDHTDSFFWKYFSSGCGCCDTDMQDVTHWMELPKPPKKYKE